MLHNICGRAKTGKTEYILDICRKMINEKKHTFLIVPEQGAVITERLVIDKLGNRSNEYIEVINFKRLCNRVFRETGGLSAAYIDEAHKLLLMYKAIENIRDLLTEYKGASKNPDFVKKALEVIAEFKMFGITSEQISKSEALLKRGGNSRLCSKLCDFSLIYAEYSRLMKEIFGYHDSADDLERLCGVLCDSKFFRGKNVIIDSFYGFTVPELNIIDRIVRDAENVYITYLFSGDDSVLFRRGNKAYSSICRFAEDNFVPYEDILPNYKNGYSDKGLELLEKGFASELMAVVPEPDNEYTGNAVRIIRCEDAYEEAISAASVINYLTSECKAKYSDIAVCARSVESYGGLIDTELSKNGVPFGLSVKYDLLTRPVVAYILSAFDFSFSKSRQSVLRMLKTGLTALSEKEADITECYIRTWNIQGRMFTEGEWMMNPDGYSDSSEMSARAMEILETVQVSREKLLSPVLVFDEEIRIAESANDISAAIVRLLENVSYKTDELSEDEIVYHNMVMDALDCIADIIGNEMISPRAYSAVFEMIIGTYDTGKIPATIDEVNVADVELFRSSGTDYMIVLGVNDGIFPRTPSQDSIFSDRERKLLADCGIELAGTSDENVYDELFLAYKVISAPSKALFLIYSEKDNGGDALAESEIISMCKNTLPNIREEQFSDCADIIIHLCDKSLAAQYNSLKNKELASAIGEHLKAKGCLPAAFSDASQSCLSEGTASALYGNEMHLSPSRLDKFNLCACSYFGTYTLGLRPETVASLGAAESGNIIHKILELLISELSEKKLRGESIDVESALKREKELLNGYISSLICGDDAHKKLSKRFKYLYGRLSGALDSCVAAMVNEISQSEFIPEDFEISIGGSSADVPFSSIPLKSSDGKDFGMLTVVGKIDRTDIYRKDDKVYIRIVDYKTGTKKFNLSDVTMGINLQMLLYLYSLTKNCGTRYGDGTAIPAGVLYTPVHRPGFNIELGEDGASNESKEFHPNGILIDDIEILTAMEKNLEGKFIPVKLKKDGSFYSYSSVTDLETMGRLLSCASDVASKLAIEIKKGKISKNPYKCEINSCSFCDMAPFCRYEMGEEGTRYSMTKYSDEVFERSVGGDDNG